jgi:thymidylate synthase
MALTPCHCFFQCYVDEGFLSLKLLIRSQDAFLGAPYNIASYALLTHILARATDLQVGRLIVSFGDAHIYLNHLKQAEELLSRCSDATMSCDMPTLVINTENTVFDKYEPNDFKVIGYDPLPAIHAPIAV